MHEQLDKKRDRVTRSGLAQMLAAPPARLAVECPAARREPAAIDAARHGYRMHDRRAARHDAL
jgi:hypothetical protein